MTMIRYIALLRGINVGGKNKISMLELKVAFEKQGFKNVSTYIASGNVIFDSELGEVLVKNKCEELIVKTFGLNIPICIISANELKEALLYAPDWWNNSPESKHNAIFVIQPNSTHNIILEIGDTKPEYEKTSYYGKVIFWSAPTKTYQRTQLTKIVDNKILYNAITIRNANTTLKLAELTK